MKSEPKPEKKLICSQGHELEIKESAVGKEGRCACNMQFVHISKLLQDGKATWVLPEAEKPVVGQVNTQNVW